MLDEFKYISKNGDIYIFISHLVKNAISEDFISKTVNLMSKEVVELLTDERIWQDNKPPSQAKIIELEEKLYKTNLAKVSNYKKWVLGYGLVLICGIFEDFLLNLLENIL